MYFKNPVILFLLFTLAFIASIFSSDYSRILNSIKLDTYEYPTKLNEDLIKPLLSDISAQQIEKDLLKFINDLPGDRYYRSNNGYRASIYLRDYLVDLVNNAGDGIPKDMFEIDLFNHKWKQPSVIFKVNSGSNSNKHKKIIIGCHIDSINFKFYQNAPGVDDNLSGIVTVIQSIKQILKFSEKNKDILKNSIEFHFYAAEEIGSVGSTEIFKFYRQENYQVIAMLQQDMTGFITKSIDSGYDEHFGIITDYTSDSLMNFTKLIIDTYCGISYLETKCGKICSDHISALMFGYPGIYVLESKVDLSNPYIHTEHDTVEHINFNHMREHTKLTVSFMLELAINDEINRERGDKYDTMSFNYSDFLIMLMMNQTKRFLLATFFFTCIVGSIYIIIESKVSDLYNNSTNTTNTIPMGDDVIQPSPNLISNSNVDIKRD